MSQELPKLVLGETYNRPRYLFEGNPIEGFPYDLWVPTLLDINGARTIHEQRLSITNAVVRNAASYSGLQPLAHNRARDSIGGVEARFRVDEGTPTLKFLRYGRTAMGFQSPDEQTTNPAYAVINKPEASYHRVVKHPDERLGDVEFELGQQVLSSLARNMDSQFPGFELPQKLEDAGITI